MNRQIGTIDWAACEYCRYSDGKKGCNAPREVGWIDLEDFLVEDGKLTCPEFEEG